MFIWDIRIEKKHCTAFSLEQPEARYVSVCYYLCKNSVFFFVRTWSLNDIYSLLISHFMGWATQRYASAKSFIFQLCIGSVTEYFNLKSVGRLSDCIQIKKNLLAIHLTIIWFDYGAEAFKMIFSLNETVKSEIKN